MDYYISYQVVAFCQVSGKREFHEKERLVGVFLGSKITCSFYLLVLLPATYMDSFERNLIKCKLELEKMLTPVCKNLSF